MIIWLEMGLQDGSRAPGWFNNYNVYIYLDNHEDPELTQAAVERDLAMTVQYFLEHPDYTADFFEKKIQSVWAEPTFQSLWIQEVKGPGWLFHRLPAHCSGKEDGRTKSTGSCATRCRA